MSKQCVQAKDAVGRNLDESWTQCVQILRPKTDEISKYMTLYWRQTMRPNRSKLDAILRPIWTQNCVQGRPTDQRQNKMAEMAEFRGREVGNKIEDSVQNSTSIGGEITLPVWSWHLYRAQWPKVSSQQAKIAIKSTQKRWACFKIWHAGSCQNSEGRMRVMTSRSLDGRNASRNGRILSEIGCISSIYIYV